MRTGWQNKKLHEICHIELGKTPFRGDPRYWDDKRLTSNVWLSIADLSKVVGSIVGDSKEYLSNEGAALCKVVPAGTLLLSFKLTIGRVAISGRDLYTNEAIAALILVPDAPDPKYLYYYFQYFDWKIISKNDTKIKGITLNKAKLKAVDVRFPPLPEQHRIVAMLDQAITSIATAKANAQRNLLNARALFESKLSRTVQSYWQEGSLVKLRDVATEITDGDHLPPPKSDAGIPFVTISNINKQTFELDFRRTFTVPHKYYNSLSEKKRPRIGDVLYTVTGSYGIPVIVKETTQFCFQRHIGLIRPNEHTDPEWLFYLLQSPQVMRQAHATASGAAQKTVSLKLLRDFTVPSPKLARQRSTSLELRRFKEQVSSIESAYRRKIAVLDELKKSLLHQAFNGDL